MNKAFLILLLLVLAACEKPAPVFEKLSQDAVILAFGDSLTYGTGASKETNYPAILSTISSFQVINAGIPGEISHQGVKRLPALLDEYQPELLILIHGGNDMLRKIPQHQTIANLKQMISIAKQHNAQVVMLGVPKPSLFLMSSADLYQQVAEELKIPIDLETLAKILSSNNLKSDAIHPNDQGYKLMAENIYMLLTETGAL